MNDNINEVFELIDNIDTVVFESYMNVIDAINSTYDKQIMIMENTNTDTSEFTIFQEEFYQEATSKKEQRRMDNFLKRHNYDPKTNTIETDMKDANGKKRRVNFETLDNSLGGPAFAQPNIYDPEDVESSSIMLTRKLLKRKPYISDGLFKHEEGHIAYASGNMKNDPDFKDNLKSVKQRIDKSKRDLHDHDKNTEEYMADAYAAKHTKKGIDGMRRALQALSSSDVKMKKDHKIMIALTKRTVDDSYTYENLPILLETFSSTIETMKSTIGFIKDSMDEHDDEETKKSNNETIKLYEDSIKKTQQIYDSLKKARKSKDVDELKNIVTKLKSDGLTELSKVIRQTDNGIKERRAFLNSLKYKK